MYLNLKHSLFSMQYISNANQHELFRCIDNFSFFMSLPSEAYFANREEQTTKDDNNCTNCKTNQPSWACHFKPNNSKLQKCWTYSHFYKYRFSLEHISSTQYHISSHKNKATSNIGKYKRKKKGQNIFSYQPF